MLIKKAPDVRSSEIAPKELFLKRREFLAASAGALVTAGVWSYGRDAAAQGGDTWQNSSILGAPTPTMFRKSPI